MTTATHPDSKALASLQARAALVGFELLPSELAGYVITRWGLSLWRADLAAVEAFLARVEGKTA